MRKISNVPMSDIENAACERLFTEAVRPLPGSPPDPENIFLPVVRDNLQGEHVAEFLLAWACSNLGPVVLKDCDGCACEKQFVEDMKTVFDYVSRFPDRCPVSLGYEDEMRRVVEYWV